MESAGLRLTVRRKPLCVAERVAGLPYRSWIRPHADTLMRHHTFSTLFPPLVRLFPRLSGISSLPEKRRFIRSHGKRRPPRRDKQPANRRSARKREAQAVASVNRSRYGNVGGHVVRRGPGVRLVFLFYGRSVDDDVAANSRSTPSESSPSAKAIAQLGQSTTAKWRYCPFPAKPRSKRRRIAPGSCALR
jgi:hypothetical protein